MVGMMYPCIRQWEDYNSHFLTGPVLCGLFYVFPKVYIRKHAQRLLRQKAKRGRILLVS